MGLLDHALFCLHVTVTSSSRPTEGFTRAVPKLRSACGKGHHIDNFLGTPWGALEIDSSFPQLQFGAHICCGSQLAVPHQSVALTE